MGKFDGRVALISGAARGQGRSHAVRLAEDGANIIGFDICADDVETLKYDLGTEADLAETVEAVEAVGGQILAEPADVRDLAAIQALVEKGVSRFGRLDIVLGNAGVCTYGPAWELTEQEWDDVVDIALTGVWKTTKAAIPTMLELGNGGNIVLTSSTSGEWGTPNIAHYVASKHGVLGLMKTLSNELADKDIRVNAVMPTTADTPLVQNQTVYDLFCPAADNPGREDMAAVAKTMQAMPIPWIEAQDISNAIAWLVSDEARYVTGTALRVDAGCLTK